MTQNADKSPDGTRSGLSAFEGHPVACAALRLVGSGICGVDATFEDEDGVVNTLDAAITSNGREIRILQREDSIRVMTDNPYPHSALPSLAGRRLDAVIDLPARAGTDWRSATVETAAVMDEDGRDVLTMRIGKMRNEKVGGDLDE